jgi:uncharacterized protein DUF2442
MLTIKKVWFDDQRIFVELSDERVIGTPIAWYPNLRKGSPKQWQKFEIWGDGTWLHWEELDEDLSLEGFLTYNQEPVKP